MIELLSLDKASFSELLRQVIVLAWSGEADAVGESQTVLGDIPEIAPSGSFIGSWRFIPIPGAVQRMHTGETIDWAVNLVLKSFKDVSISPTDIKNYRGPGFAFVPASSELGSALTAQISSIRATLRERYQMDHSVEIEVVHPGRIATAVADTVRIRRAFQAADQSSLDLLIDTPNENLAHGVRMAIGASARQMLPSAHISLTQAGATDDESAKLASIFFDPSAASWPAAKGEVSVCASVVTWLDVPLLAHSLSGRNVRLVLVGGPGQGKSTVLQFIAQLYRAEFLQNGRGVSAEVRAAAAQTLTQAAKLSIPRPALRRWPIQVSLARYAEHLTALRSSPVTGVGAEDERATREGLLAFIVSKLPTVQDSPSRSHHLRSWLQEWPSVLLLDGMDETPPELRTLIREQIDDLEELASQMGADLPIIVTSRPQGFVTDFPFDRWDHFRLSELNEAQSTNYASAVIDLRNDLDPDDEADLRRRIEVAITSPSTARLTRTPLQITILTLLFQQNLAAQSRFQLFDGYFTVVYRREAKKPGALGEFIQQHQPELEELHERAGFLLHLRSEHGADAQLSNDELNSLLGEVLRHRGYESGQANMDRLRSAIVDRLVLLVGPHEDNWQFEVRVLQEYMTARHWTSGDNFNNEALEVLLRQTLPLQFWRTVWSLAAGRILSSRAMFRQTLLAALSEANNADAVSISGRPASRIAVELLSDVVSANRPADTRTIVNLALENLQDLSQHAIGGLAEAMATLLLADEPTKQLLTGYVDRIGSQWSLERVALTSLLRAIRLRTQNNELRRRIDDWLRTLGNLNDQVRVQQGRSEVSLSVVLSIVSPGFNVPTSVSRKAVRFDLQRDGLGTGHFLDSGGDVSPKIAELIGEDSTAAEWFAQCESSLRRFNPRLAQQLRDGLAYWRGLRPLTERLAPTTSQDALFNPLQGFIRSRE
ncbi:NACHT domain-containing protein [Leifsonia xyli]|uniref:NACHT domain-containing protein n=1 Tax=Leifsonia xyli TaxID=1575 RepID=UPI003D677E23